MMTERIRERRRTIKWGILFLVFTVSLVLYYVCCKKTLTDYNSDFSYYAVAGKDIFSGNILLNGWYGCTNSFYFLALLYGFFGQVFGYSLNLIPLVSAFLWAGLLTLISYIVFCLYSDKSNNICITRICLAFVLCFSSCFCVQNYKIYAGAHFDVILIGIFYIWVIASEIESCKNNTIQLVAASILLLLALWSDGLTQIFIVLPVLIVLAFNLLFVPAEKAKKKYVVKHLILIVALLVVSKIVFSILQHAGMVITFWPVGVTEVPDWPELFSKIAYFIKTVLYMFNCDIFGGEIGIHSAALIFRVLILMLLLLGLALSLKSLVRNIFNHFLLCCIAVVSLVIVLTQYGGETWAGPEWTSRLTHCFYISLVLQFVQIDWIHLRSLVQVKIGKKLWLAAGIAVMSLLMVFNLSILRTEENNVSSTYDSYTRVADTLAQRGLTRGCGTFWLSNVVTLASGLQVEVSPVLDENLATYLWLSKGTCDWENANFVLVDASMWGNVTEESIINCIGVPAERLQVDEITILIYDKNILPYIINSGQYEETGG